MSPVGGSTAESASDPPPTLAATGLYSDFAARELAPGVLPFEPQYPLWSDGAHKRRWIRLPPGGTIDATDPDIWSFPPGTRFWKEFAFERPVETRFIERLPDGSWRFAAYVWNAEGTEAVLAPYRGVRRVAESSPGVPYDVPAVTDCRACHLGHPATILGFSALQLSTDRDPLAPHASPPPPGAVDLAALVARGLVVGLPAPIAAHPPRVRAAGPVGRAALGYLHANCGNCHNRGGPLADLDFSLAVGADGEPQAPVSSIGRLARYRPAGSPELPRLVRGDPEASLIFRRLASRQPLLQMPPLGTRSADPVAVALVGEWIRTELARPRTPSATVLAATPAASLPEEELP